MGPNFIHDERRFMFGSLGQSARLAVCGVMCAAGTMCVGQTPLAASAPAGQGGEPGGQQALMLFSAPRVKQGDVVHYEIIIQGTRGQGAELRAVPEIRVPVRLTVLAADADGATVELRPTPPAIKDLSQDFMTNNFLLAAGMQTSLQVQFINPTPQRRGKLTITNGNEALAASREKLDELIQQAIGSFKGMTLEQINKERATFGAVLGADSVRTMLELYTPITSAWWSPEEPMTRERDIALPAFAGLTVPARERTTVQREQDGGVYTRTVIRTRGDADFIKYFKAVGEKIGMELNDDAMKAAAERGDIYFETRTDLKTDERGLLVDGTHFIEQKFGVSRRSNSRSLRAERVEAPKNSAETSNDGAAKVDRGPRIPMDFKVGEEVGYRATFRLTLGQGTQQDRLRAVRMPFTLRVVAREGEDAIVECEAKVPAYVDMDRNFLHNYARTLAPFESAKPRIRLVAEDGSIRLENEDEVAKAAATRAGPMGEALGLYKSLSGAQRTQTVAEFERVLAESSKAAVFEVLGSVLGVPNGPIPPEEVEFDAPVTLATGRELKGRHTISVEQTKNGFKRTERRVARNSPELSDAMLRTLIDMGYKLSDQDQRKVRDSRSANVREQLTHEVDARGWVTKAKHSTLVRSGLASIAFDAEVEIERMSEPRVPGE